MTFGDSYYVPSDICYSNSSGNVGDFYASTSLPGGASIAYYEWQSDAGIMFDSGTSLASVVFNNPGYRYVRIRSVNNCGVESPWFTQYFTLTYDDFGCGDGGMNFSMTSSPNPTSDEITIVVKGKDSSTNESKQKSNASNYIYRYMILNHNQEVVYDQKSSYSTHKVRTHNLPNGRYILKVTSPHGSKTQHIIVKHDR